MAVHFLGVTFRESIKRHNKAHIKYHLVVAPALAVYWPANSD